MLFSRHALLVFTQLMFPTLAAGAENHCQSRVNRHKGICYWVGDSGDYDESKAYCANNQGVLATVDNKKTSDIIVSFLQDTGTTLVWVGWKKGSNRWADGTWFSWTNWAKDEGTQSWELCLSIWQYEWRDAQCQWKPGPLCQTGTVTARNGTFKAFDPINAVESNFLLETIAVSRTGCALKCLNIPDCWIFKYVKVAKTCSLYNSPDGPPTFPRGTSTEWYYLD